MPTSVTLPALGESVTEGTVTRWLKQVGDNVEADEPLLEVSTDKVDTEIPSPAAGVLLEITAQEDETVEVGAVLGLIGEASEAVAAGDGPDSAPEAEEQADAQPPVTSDSGVDGHGAPAPPPRPRNRRRPKQLRRPRSPPVVASKPAAPRSPCRPWVKASPKAR